MDRDESPVPDAPPAAAAIPEPSPILSSAFPRFASDRNWSSPKGSASSASASNSTGAPCARWFSPCSREPSKPRSPALKRAAFSTFSAAFSSSAHSSSCAPRVGRYRLSAAAPPRKSALS